MTSHISGAGADTAICSARTGKEPAWDAGMHIKKMGVESADRDCTLEQELDHTIEETFR